jgi:hypothetical protein
MNACQKWVPMFLGSFLKLSGRWVPPIMLSNQSIIGLIHRDIERTRVKAYVYKVEILSKYPNLVVTITGFTPSQALDYKS